MVEPGAAAGIAGRDPAWTGGPDFADLTREELGARAGDALAHGKEALSDAQELLWASDRYALLVVLQAMDAAGKDSAIEYVMSGVNPQGVQVVSFADRRRKNSTTTTSGGSRRRFRSAAGSASSTARTTRRSLR